jgi:Flp pilus assembly protein TadG
MGDGRTVERRQPERGSTLLLFPAAVLVLLTLAAIAVDLSGLHLARRELSRATEQAADDAAAMIDEAAARGDGEAHIDHAAAERVVRFELAVARLRGRLIGSPHVVVDDRTDTVTVEATIEVDPVFGSVPGRGPQRITVRSVGRLIDGG